MKYKITYGKNVYGKQEISSVHKCISKTTQMGKNVYSFEEKISKLTCKKYTVMVNSGSSACLLLSEVLKLKKNDEFIIPAVNFPTAIVPFIKKGLVPRVLDVNLDNLQINLDELKRNINNKTKFILIPNLIGNIPRWDLIRKIVGKRIVLIEDSADTLDARINSIPTGHYSDYTICSFYGSHVINCAGNGGSLSLNNKNEYLRAKIIRSWGRLSSIINEDNHKERFNYKIQNKIYDKKFVFSEQGYNLEPSEIGAAFGLVQLKKLKKNLNTRIRNYNLLKNYFNYKKKYFNFINNEKIIKTSLLAFPIIIKNNSPFKRFELQIFLEKNKIQTRPIFSGNFLIQPAFKRINYVCKSNLFNSNIITSNGLMFGLHHGLNINHINYIIKIFDKFLSKY
jgi:CDP-6-deoxy-D-xylo-4-hexulose-3-dehydrase